DPIPDPAPILEDSPQQTLILTGISGGPANESDPTLTVTATSNYPALILNPTVNYTSPPPTGSLSYTPAKDANRTAVITVTVTGSGGHSVRRQFTVTVVPVNDAPTFTKGPNQTVAQGSGPQTIPNWATNVSPGPLDEAGQSLTFLVISNTNPGLFSQ